MSTDNIFHRNNDATTGDFSDSCVILVKPDDVRIVMLSDATVSAQQAFDGPTFLVIAASAPDDVLERAANRYAIPVQALRQFRGEPAHA